MSKHNELLYRVYITMLVVIAVAGLLSFKAFKIAIVEGDRWSAKGDSLYLEYFPVDAQRGDIYSQDRRLLATSLPLFEIRMDTRANGLTEEAFRQGVDSLAWYLSRYANTSWSPGTYRNYLVKRRSKGDRYLLIAKDVDFEELGRFRKFPIFRRGQNSGGFIVVRTNKRVHPYNMLAARTLGYTRESVQPVGLEGYFDEEMRGVDGQRLMQKIRGAWIPVNQFDQVESQRGADIVTTIDIEIQDIVQQELLAAVEHHRATWGTAVLMDVKSGAVRAIANWDVNKHGNYYEGYNHAVGSATEPGSTFKLPAVMAMFEDGYADLTTRVDLHNGKTRLYNQRLEDSHWHPHRETDLRHAFEISSNVGIATIADNVYNKTRKGHEFIQRLEQFGLRRTTGIEIPGEGQPRIKEAYNTEQLWSSTSIPWMSHGYELRITPLQLLTFYSAVANNGKMMKPHLVTAIERDGRVIERFKPEVVINRIASESTIDKAQELLEGVMIRGTGEDQQSDYVTMAGKTGTAVVEYFIQNGGRRKYQGSFAGYFPTEDPQYGLVIVIYDPKANGFYGGSVALPAFKNIAERVMARQLNGFAISDSSNTNNTDVRTALAYKSDVVVLAEELGVAFGEVTDADWVTWDSGAGENLIAREVTDYTVPDLQGIGLRDAMYLLENAGLDVQVSGYGKVKKQSVKAGTKVSKGTQIKLVLG